MIREQFLPWLVLVYSHNCWAYQLQYDWTDLIHVFVYTWYISHQLFDIILLSTSNPTIINTLKLWGLRTIKDFLPLYSIVVVKYVYILRGCFVLNLVQYSTELLYLIAFVNYTNAKRCRCNRVFVNARMHYVTAILIRKLWTYGHSNRFCASAFCLNASMGASRVITDSNHDWN